MGSPSLLKAEINQTLEDLHDFAKWKLIAVSALAAAALGLPGAVTDGAVDWLLVFVPYACAYIDLNCYQYLLRIFLIAKVLRESHEDELLHKYEDQCEEYRKKGFFGLGLFAQLGCSLAFSTILPGFCAARILLGNAETWKLRLMLIAWLVGLSVLCLCYVDFKRRAALIENGSANTEAGRMNPTPSPGISSKAELRAQPHPPEPAVEPMPGGESPPAQ